MKSIYLCLFCIASSAIGETIPVELKIQPAPAPTTARVIGGSDADQLVSWIFRAEGRDAGLDNRIGFVRRRRGQRRRRKGDGLDFLDGNLPSAFLVNLSVEDVLGSNDERGLRRLRWRRRAVREIADDAGGGGSGFFVLGESRRKAGKRGQ